MSLALSGLLIYCPRHMRPPARPLPPNDDTLTSRCRLLNEILNFSTLANSQDRTIALHTCAQAADPAILYINKNDLNKCLHTQRKPNYYIFDSLPRPYIYIYICNIKHDTIRIQSNKKGLCDVRHAHRRLYIFQTPRGCMDFDILTTTTTNYCRFQNDMYRCV